MSLLLDCGFRSQRDCNRVLDGIRGELAVLISHAHQDHLSQPGARTLSRRGIGIHAHCDAIDGLRRSWDMEDWDVKVMPFGALPFVVGPFLVRAVDVPHAPSFANVAFVLECGSGASHRKMVFCTDTYDAGAIRDELVDADLIYIESNHDLELLERFPNPASRYHLSNVKTAGTLCDAIRKGRVNPQAIMLGHLSEERNRPGLAMETLRDCFARACVHLASRVIVAPAKVASEVIVVE